MNLYVCMYRSYYDFLYNILRIKSVTKPEERNTQLRNCISLSFTAREIVNYPSFYSNLSRVRMRATN